MRFLLYFAIPSLLSAQISPPATAPHAAPVVGPNAAGGLAYRGFVIAAPFAEFATRARAVVAPGAAPLICNTSRHTAKLMECGALIRDPDDSAGFYLAAYVIEQQVAFLSFGDSGTTTLVERSQRDLEQRFGRPHASRAGMWEWRSGRQLVRLTWRGRGPARWIYIALWDEAVMDRIAAYARRRTP